jgi:hypothetical protein
MVPSVKVNVDNFARAETARMFDEAVLGYVDGKLATWAHNRVPTPIEHQPVIRMNRDTLYSMALLDLSKPATVTLPETHGRYRTVMILDEDHHVDTVFHEPGTYELTNDRAATRFVAALMRIFVDPANPDDIAEVNALQDATTLDAGATGPYEHPPYDEASRKTTFEALAALGNGLDDTARMFGSRAHTDPVRHLIGTAVGWGGLPETEAFYIIDTEPRTVAHYALTLRDVPVDGFWSMTIYDRDGFMHPNPYDSYSANNVTSVSDEDGSVTLHLAPEGDGLQNHLYVMDGWNYAFRLYRPRRVVLDGTWRLPQIERVG